MRQPAFVRLIAVVSVVLCASTTSFSFNARKSRFWQNLEAGKPQKLAIIGTSLSFSGNDQQAGNVSWPLDLKAELDRLFPGLVSISNHSTKGVYSSYVFSKVASVIAEKADGVIVEYASNDAVNRFGCRVETCSRPTGAGIVSTLQAALPATDIFMYVTALPWDADLSCCQQLNLCGDGCAGEAWEKFLCDPQGAHLCRRGGRKFIETYFQAMRDIANEYDTYLIDTYWKFAALYDRLGPTQAGYGQFLGDGHHPNRKAAIEIVVPMMLDVFKGTAGTPAIDILEWFRGREFLAGSTVELTWVCNPDSVSTGTVSIQLSIDKGATWKSIGLDGLSLTQKKASWTIPASVLGDAFILDDVVLRAKIDGRNSSDISGLFSIRKEAMDDIIIDEKNTAQITRVGYFGAGGSMPTAYLGNATGSAVVGKTNSFTFRATVQKSGSYGIYMWWPVSGSACPSVPVTVTHALGSVRKAVNMKENGGRWNLLGTWNLQAGKEASVKLETVGAAQEGTMYADAVRFRGITAGTVDAVAPADIENRAGTHVTKAHFSLAAVKRGASSVIIPAGARRCRAYDMHGRLAWQTSDPNALKAGGLLRAPAPGVTVYRFD